MELLYNQGGYMDIDTISVRPYHHLLEHQCVLGYQDNPEGLRNAVMMCQPKCLFFKKWLSIYKQKYISSKGPGTPGWDNASIKLPYKIYLSNKNLVTMLEKESFFYPNWSQTEKIFEEDTQLDSNLITLHLWESSSMKYLEKIENFDWFKNNPQTLYGRIGLKLIDNYNLENYNDIPKIIHQT